MNRLLRPPQALDFAAIASWIDNAESCIRWAGPRLSFPFSATDLPRLLSLAEFSSYCLADGPSAACGFGQYWVVTPGEVHLGRIIVSPTRRRQGLGRVLCQQLMAEAVQNTGARALTLRVYRDNSAAIALYGSLGFAQLEAQSTDAVLFMQTGVDRS